MTDDDVTGTGHLEAVLRRSLIEAGFDAGAFPLDADLRDIGVDSFASLDFIARIEAQFAITIPDERLDPREVRTLRRAVSLVADLSKRD